VRLSRVFHDGPLKAGQLVSLTESSAHHLRTVLRIKARQEIVLFNGLGGEYLARIHTLDKKSLIVEVLRHEDIDRESFLDITLVQGISKGQRMDYSIQKAVELGVYAIQPIITERCAIRQKGDRVERKGAHWEGVIRSASEQSGRTRLPQLLEPMPLRDYLKHTSNTALKLVLDPLARHHLGDLSSQHQEIDLLVGPEGGLSENEIQAACEAGFQSISLGPRILRTETAGAATIAAIQALWGDFCQVLQ
jgi:16S rRNA (uracil1498-N3)-methyltransferase